jgi:hypothetical protein
VETERSHIRLAELGVLHVNGSARGLGGKPTLTRRAKFRGSGKPKGALGILNETETSNGPGGFSVNTDLLFCNTMICLKGREEPAPYAKVQTLVTHQDAW